MVVRQDCFDKGKKTTKFTETQRDETPVPAPHITLPMKNIAGFCAAAIRHHPMVKKIAVDKMVFFRPNRSSVYDAMKLPIIAPIQISACKYNKKAKNSTNILVEDAKYNYIGSVKII